MRPAITSGIVAGNAPVSYWPTCFPSIVTVPEVFSKINSIQFPSRFLTGEFAISTFPIIHFVCVFLALQHAQTVLHTHCLHFSRDDWKPQKKMKIKLMQNCLRVLGGKKHKQRVLWEMCKWRVIINRQRAVTRVVIRVSRTCPSTD